MTAPLCLRANWVMTRADRPMIHDGAVVVTDGRISAVGPAVQIKVPDDAQILNLGNAVLMPGLINAHQHGRGVSQLLMGYPDLALEPWIAGRKRHAPPDIYTVTRLAAEKMLANGVTATLHANYAYGSGDYETELRAQLSAYCDAGLRVTVCVGLQDRGGLVYPDGDVDTFVAQLPPAARAVVTGTPPAPYMADWAASSALMDRLQVKYGDNRLITLAWGPAGPQWVGDDLWRCLAADAAARTIGVHFHLLESPAQAAAARQLYPGGTLARLRDLGLFSARTSCAHGVNMTQEDMIIAAAEGLVLVLNPGSNLRLRNGPPPVADLRAAGVQLAVGTDNCALNDCEDLLAELRLTNMLGHCTAQHGMAQPDAGFAMVHANGAAAAFLSADTGSIAQGASADLSAFALGNIAESHVLPPDRVAELLVARASGGDCVLTMVAGRVRYKANPQDIARLTHWQAEAAATIAARAELASAEAISDLQLAICAHYAARASD